MIGWVCPRCDRVIGRDEEDERTGSVDPVEPDVLVVTITHKVCPS